MANLSNINNKFLVQTGGNVGIGTTSPTQLLHVNSSINNPTGIGLQNSERYYAVRSNNYSLVFSDETVGLERMRIDSSGNVGIKNTSPSDFNTWQRQLVVGNGTADAGITIYHGSGSGNQGAIAFADGNTGTDRYRGVISYNGADEMKFYTSTLERMRINDAGNVFISTPITNAFYGLSLTYNNNNTADFTVNQATGQIKIGGVLAGYYPTFYAAGAEKMRIDTSGNLLLGAGTGNPYLALVSAGGNGGNQRARIFGYADGGTYGGGLQIQTRNDVNVFGTAVTIDHDKNVGIGVAPSQKLEINGAAKFFGATSSNFAQTGGQIDYYDTGRQFRFNAYKADATGAEIVFNTGGTSSFNQRMVIDSSGNVGIGVTSPNAKLSINGWTYNPGAAAASGMIGLKQGNNSAYGFVAEASDTDKWLMMGHNSSHGIIETTYAASAGHSDLYIKTGGANKLILQSSGGNVGIGTTSPSETLQVNGNIYVEDGQTTGLGVILQNGDRPMITRGWDAFTSGSYAGIGRWGLFMEVGTTFLASPGTDYTNGVVALGGYTASGTPQYNLIVNNYTKRVGIGTTNPYAPLHVSHSLGNGGLMLGNTATTGSREMLLNIHPLGLIWQRWVNGAYQSNLMTLDYDGNLGIGTTTPASELHVESANPIITLQRNNNGNASGAVQFRGSDNLVDWQIGTNQVVGLGLEFNFQNSNKVYIETGGNVGIATISPQAKLQVNQSGAALVGAIIKATDSGYYNQVLQISCARGATTGYNLIQGLNSNTTECFKVAGSGNVSNTNNSYGAISDIKLKENIIDATPKLEDLMQIKIRNYNIIGDKNKQIGVIAQELEEIFPSMIDESIDYEEQEITNEEGNVSTEQINLGTTTKSVKYSVFVPMLIKAIQELKAEIDELKK